MKKLLIASVAVIGLLLAGPQKASAEVIYACVSTIGNIAVVASASAPCPPNVGSATWIKINWNVNSGGQASNVLYTGPISILGPNYPICQAVNVNAQSRTLQAQVIKVDGQVQATSGPLVVQPGQEIAAATEPLPSPGGSNFYCKFTVSDGTSSDIRGTIQACSLTACGQVAVTAQ